MGPKPILPRESGPSLTEAVGSRDLNLDLSGPAAGLNAAPRTLALCTLRACIALTPDVVAFACAHEAGPGALGNNDHAGVQRVIRVRDLCNGILVIPVGHIFRLV